MSTAEMKLDLLKTINSLEEDQIEEMYKIVNHHLNDDDDDWNEPFPLSELDEAIKEANNGELTPVDDVIKELRNKYGLNG